MLSKLADPACRRSETMMVSWLVLTQGVQLGNEDALP